ncbi:MFS transporter, FSR family, fosmidomycin resistance protein [Propionispira arboris]|uniref:MFS transporter, FSR family, fosmidomycin resistance protein n=1 Tax=Propionispira arboris TaxID=84035 RepID=A0A1H6Z051_9FIRM|nr:MFS transporter [Propionispira arboris]SEJ45394.1 MFS transporter, FSR family, fosmidomycin resistance protein [Propionispira arboris]
MNRKYVYVLALGHFFCDIGMGALPAILPFFILQYGMDYQSAAGLMFASCFLSSVVQPAFGYLADRTSKIWFMPLGVFVSGAAMGLAGLFENYWAIFAVVTLSGIGSAIFHPEAARMIHKISGTKKGTALSIFSVGGNSGFAVGPMIAVATITAFGMKGTAIFCFLALIMSFVLLMIVPKIKAAIVEKYSLSAATNIESKVKKVGAKNDWSSFSRLTMLIIFSSIVICGLRSFIPLYWVQVMGLSTAAAGSALTLLFTLGIVTTFIGGLLADKLGYLKVVQFSYVLLVPMVAMLSQTTNPVMAYLLMIPIGFAMFAPFSSIVVLGQSYLARSIGFASGVTLGLSFSVGGVIVPFIGRFADTYGLNATMELLAVVAIFAAIFAFFLPKPVKVV